MSGHSVHKAPLDASTGCFETTAQPWAINHPELLAVANNIQSHTIPDMANLSLEIATKPREEPWTSKTIHLEALRAGGAE